MSRPELHTLLFPDEIKGEISQEQSQDEESSQQNEDEGETEGGEEDGKEEEVEDKVRKKYNICLIKQWIPLLRTTFYEDSLFIKTKYGDTKSK